VARSGGSRRVLVVRGALRTMVKRSSYDHTWDDPRSSKSGYIESVLVEIQEGRRDAIEK
jgi:hypothetical protein